MVSAATALNHQWRSPNDVLSVVMLIGGDIIQRAIAQLAGPHLVPVAFSFGWVAYAFSALMAAFGDGRLMPPTDCPSIVVNAHTGFARNNDSWVLGRILRDLEHIHKSKHKSKDLTIQVYNALPHGCHPRLRDDGVRLSGLAVIIVQLGIAAIPWALQGDWIMFLETGAGTILALVSGALPQWKREKWACRELKGKKKSIALLKGNGGHLVIVVVDDEGVGLNLEDLAAARVECDRWTREILCLLCLLWLVLLINVAGLQVDAWYLMAIGMLGMIQNVVAAGARRSPEQFRIPLELQEEISCSGVMKTLQALERRYSDAGYSLLKQFFPGDLRDDEKEWWNNRSQHAQEFREREVTPDAGKENCEVKHEVARRDEGHILNKV
ncbi:hypothetical protein FISHEDRAFT_63306 [Fistulina hepatica ATCC 64428]|uniref:Uncharacterized protein n=1 Tax=Fistulina hepatica ATCC 64428 TaxID=1128425 RepID=A0A0D7AQM5_9AGAR|nr:hypothetical protein FISHEDRAFT_63306 [Fistulina hepatica ATCC 64428]